MADDEDNNWMQDDDAGEQEEKERVRSAPKRPEEHKTEKTEEKTEAQRIIEEKQRKHEQEEAENLAELEAQRRAQREREDAELEKLKQKQAQRKKEREEEDRKMEEQKKLFEEQRRQEQEQMKVKQEEERRKKQEEAERKKAMAQAAGIGGRNFTIQKATGDDGGSTLDKFMNISKAQTEMSLNAHELEALKRKTVNDRVKTLSVADLGKSELKAKAEELWKQIINIETSKYDLTMRQERQDYDLKELNERQRQINKNKYVKMGLDPEANSRYPPKVQLISKYERRTDRRSYEDRKGLFDKLKEDEKKELVRPKAVKRETWIKDKVEESKRTYDEESEETYTRPSRTEDDDEGYSRPSNTYSSHQEEEEVAADED